MLFVMERPPPLLSTLRSSLRVPRFLRHSEKTDICDGAWREGEIPQKEEGGEGRKSSTFRVTESCSYYLLL